MVIAFMTCNGYNYEDAVVLNEKLVKDAQEIEASLNMI